MVVPLQEGVQLIDFSPPPTLPAGVWRSGWMPSHYPPYNHFIFNILLFIYIYLSNPSILLAAGKNLDAGPPARSTVFNVELVY